MTVLLARINARLDEIEAGPAVVGVALFLTAALFGTEPASTGKHSRRAA